MGVATRVYAFLRDLLDVDTTGVSDGDALTYDAATQKWIPGAGGGGGGAPADADYLVGTANATLSNEIVVGATPGGELGGTWAAPTVDTVHSGSSHAATQAAAEATAAAALSAHVTDPTDAHAGTAIGNTPAGGIAATTVQAAINELDTEKANAASAVMDGDAAGGVLGGTYPNPSFAVDMATQAELDAHEADTTNVHGIVNTADLYRVGGTDVAVADGGTGASTAADARTNLGLGTVATLASDTDGTLAANSDARVATQKATKTYVDAVAQGLSIKASCRVATAAALPANTYLAGVLTAVANGALTVDGVAVSAGDRVLVKDEATAANNGIYTVTAVGSAGTPYVLTRSSDMDEDDEVAGAFSFVEDGTANSGAGFVVASSGPFTIGVTAINWTQFSGAGEITAGAALTKTGNTLDVAVDGTTIEVNADALRVVPNTFQPLDPDLTAIAGLTPSNDDVIQRKAGAWTNRTMAQLRTDLDVPTNAEAILDTIVDAKGDLIVGTAADTVARLAVGATDGHVLTVDAAQAAGIKWAAAASGVPDLQYESRSTNTILGVADKGKTIDITAAITQTFEADETLDDGWWVILRNATDDGTTVVTLNPAGTETIDGLTTVTMYSGEARLIFCNGAGGNFNSVLLAGGFALFTADDNFIVPHGITQVDVHLYGGGGGGGGGRGGAAGSVRQGGTAGGGGACVRATLPAAQLGNPGDSIAVDVATGGTSGAGGSSADGSNGGAGGTSTFGTLVTAYGGGGGLGGSNSANGRSGGGGGGATAAGGVGQSNTASQGGGNIPLAVTTLGSPGQGTSGANSSQTDGQSPRHFADAGGASGGTVAGGGGFAGGGGGPSVFGGSAGGGGGSLNTSNTETAGGAGGTSPLTEGGIGSGGAVNGGAGAAGTDRSLTVRGSAGAGGGAQDSGTGGAGGNGGAGGHGAGGGGAGTSTGGAGGVGGRGECRVWYS